MGRWTNFRDCGRAATKEWDGEPVCNLHYSVAERNAKRQADDETKQNTDANRLAEVQRKIRRLKLTKLATPYRWTIGPVRDWHWTNKVLIDIDVLAGLLKK